MHYLIHSHKTDYYKSIYPKLRELIPDKQLLILPHETEEYVNSLPIIDKSDAIFVIGKDLGTSFGSGIEVGYALAKGKNIHFFIEIDGTVPSSLSVIPATRHYYKSIEELAEIISSLVKVHNWK